MKKLAIGIFSAALILGAGTYAFAQSNENGERAQNFKEMVPFMQKMHPGFSEGELENMHKACHGANRGPGHMFEQQTTNMSKF